MIPAFLLLPMYPDKNMRPRFLNLELNKPFIFVKEVLENVNHEMINHFTSHSSLHLP